MFYAQKTFLSETCVALLDNQKRPIIYYWTRQEDVNLGDEYVCKITKKMPFIHGYFAQIDHNRNLFVESKKSLEIGQFMRVVITKEQRLDKVPQAKVLSAPPTHETGLVKKGNLLQSINDSTLTEQVVWNESFDEDVSESLNSLVFHECGARIIFEQTHAFYSIDVDSANCTTDILTLNQLAAIRIGQEIVKRNLSGNIIIDFMGHKDRQYMAQLKQLLANELQKDPTPYRIFGATSMGNMEIRRDRTRMSLPEASRTLPAVCYDMFRQMLKTPTKIDSVRVSLEIYNALTGLMKNTFEQVTAKMGESVRIKACPNVKNFEVEYKS